MKICRVFEKLKSCRSSDIWKPNYLALPVTKVSVDEYNNLIDWCIVTEDMHRGISRTKSGGISVLEHQCNVWESYPRKTDKGTCLGAELVMLISLYDEKTNEEFTFGGRVQIGKYLGDEQEKHLCGRIAYLKFREMLDRRGMKIEDYFQTSEEGRKNKMKIEKPWIMLGYSGKTDYVYEHVYHYDLNSSYGSGMAECVPDWADLVNYLYENRKKRIEYKDVLNMTIGFFQSAYINYQLSYVSEYCIRRNNEKLCDMSERLIKLGCHIILYNTDGIWFTKPDNVELVSSYKLGEWKIDHKDCKMRIKSAGVYEYIENGKYTPIVRGQTELDRIKDRSEWEWGDIYTKGCRIIVYSYLPNGKISEDIMEG